MSKAYIGDEMATVKGKGQQRQGLENVASPQRGSPIAVNNLQSAQGNNLQCISNQGYSAQNFGSDINQRGRGNSAGQLSSIDHQNRRNNSPIDQRGRGASANPSSQRLSQQQGNGNYTENNFQPILQQQGNRISRIPQPMQRDVVERNRQRQQQMSPMSHSIVKDTNGQEYIRDNDGNILGIIDQSSNSTSRRQSIDPSSQSPNSGSRQGSVVPSDQIYPPSAPPMARIQSSVSFSSLPAQSRFMQGSSFGDMQEIDEDEYRERGIDQASVSPSVARQGPRPSRLLTEQELKDRLRQTSRQNSFKQGHVKQSSELKSIKSTYTASITKAKVKRSKKCHDKVMSFLFVIVTLASLAMMGLGYYYGNLNRYNVSYQV